MAKKKKKGGKLKRFVFILLIMAAVASLYAGYVYLTLPDVTYLQNENPKTTAMMEQRKKEAEKKGETLDIRHRWVPFKIIPELLKRTVLVSEDAGFYYHNGVDYHELKESIKRNLREGKKARGGSTITQQLAKNLFLSTEKSYSRKAREFLIAQKMEKHLSKNRIFSIYLNVIEFGKGIFGVEAAAEHFFNKPVDQLNLEEIIRLVSIIPKPLKVNPLSARSRYLKWRANFLLDKLVKYEIIPETDYYQVKRVFADTP